MDPARPDEPPAAPPPTPPKVEPTPVRVHLHRLVPPHQYLWVIGFLGPVLTPFLVGAIMAYIGAPIVDRLQKRGMRRTTGTLIVTLMFGLAGQEW